jgi:hypothetical protein
MGGAGLQFAFRVFHHQRVALAAMSVRTEAEAAAVLAGFETEHRLFELSVRGVSVWRLLRFPVGFALQNLPFSKAPLPRGELLAAFFRSLRDLVRLPTGARYAVKSYVSALRVRGEHGYEDIYFERLLDEVSGGVRLYSLNAPGYFGRKAGSAAPMIDCTAVNVAGALLAKVLPVREGDAVFAKLSELIGRRLGITEFPAGRIRRMFSSFWWQSRLYERILRRLGAKTVFAADTGERALLGACRRLGVRFVELQHGIFTPDHPDSLPVAVLALAEETALLLPDVVALYGDYWLARQADSVLGKTGRLLSVGASVIERFRAMRARDFRPSPECPCLVVTTQGIDRDALIGFLSRFLSLYPEPCLLTIKLHPAYDISLDHYLIMLGSDSRVRIVGGRDDPNTYELIAGADLHLSIASACHYDALGIGTPTLIIGLAGYPLVQSLIDSGDALFAGDSGALADIVARRAWAPVTTTVSDKYYRHGFVQNMSALIV